MRSSSVRTCTCHNQIDRTKPFVYMYIAGHCPTEGPWTREPNDRALVAIKNPAGKKQCQGYAGMQQQEYNEMAKEHEEREVRDEKSPSGREESE